MMRSDLMRVLTILVVVLSTARGAPPKADYLAHASESPGNPDNGMRVFTNPRRGLCATCHTIDGSGSKMGPDLSSIGDKFSRRDLIESILNPSSTVAVGFGATIVTTTGDEVLAGVVRDTTETGLTLLGVDGALRTIPISEIRTREESTASLMPEGLHASLSREEFTDLVSWLETLRSSGAESEVEGTPREIPVSSRSLVLEPLFPEELRFDEPTWMGWLPGQDQQTAVVADHGGGLWVVEDGQRRRILDLTPVVRRGGATGLLSIAFHPKFADNRRYFLKYQTVQEGGIFTIIEERRFAVDRHEDSGDAPRQLFKIPSATQDHNGGSMGFGPDGYLYFGMGDTGPQHDPRGHSQNMGLLLGKLLRIDVDTRDPGLPYGIPDDNPFLNHEGVRPEIWASGFREPWRLSWDRETGELWVGDVGQNRFEEVAIVRRGENHGWNVMEGHRPHSDRYKQEDLIYTAPLLSYARRHGVSVTGGYVYRGTRAPRLRGWYIFGDFESRRIWALTQKNGTLTRIIEIGRAPTRISSFAEEENGELCLVGFNNGTIYRMDLSKVDPRPRQTEVLAATCEKSGVTWRYTFRAPAAGWDTLQFDDTAWPEGAGGFGTPGTPGAIVRTRWDGRDIWLRRSFTVTGKQLEPGSKFLLRLHHDEDVEVYLNGKEVLSRPRWTSGYVEVELADLALRQGRNLLAVHCRQNSGGQYIDVGILQVRQPAP